GHLDGHRTAPGCREYHALPGPKTVCSYLNAVLPGVHAQLLAPAVSRERHAVEGHEQLAEGRAGRRPGEASEAWLERLRPCAGEPCVLGAHFRRLGELPVNLARARGAPRLFVAGGEGPQREPIGLPALPLFEPVAGLLVAALRDQRLGLEAGS